MEKLLLIFFSDHLNVTVYSVTINTINTVLTLSAIKKK